MLKISALVILLITFIYSSAHKVNDDPKFPFQDPTLDWDKRLDDLVSRLTIEEIMPQTLAVYGEYTPEIARLGIKPYVWITECGHGQMLINTTAFPQSLGLAASFSPELVEKVTEAISEEVRGQWNWRRQQGKYETFSGLTCFSPEINLMRHPLWGRGQETFGEDPFLTGSISQGFVKGLQGNHPRYLKVGAGCKAFDAYTGPENIPVSRLSFDAKLSMRDWRMTFLPAFKMCLEAGSYSLMCSYNSVNGIPACMHKQLLTDIIRTEWGFKGYVVSDDDALPFIISEHKYLKNETDVAAAAMKAGCNLELGDTGKTVFSHQLESLKLGLLTEKELRDNVRPLMYTRLRLGEWDPEQLNPYNSINISSVQSAQHRDLSLDAAMRSFVLLKNNNNALPLLKKYKQLAIVGPFAKDKVEIFGSYSSSIVAQYTKSVAEGLTGLADTQNVAPGCDTVKCEHYDSEPVRAAVSSADLIIVTAGLGPTNEDESNDRRHINLPGSQLQLMQDSVEYAGASVPVILLLFNAGPLDITWAKLHPRVSAILECFYPGQTTGDAVYGVLTASKGPSSVPAARLPNTWPSHLLQVPDITNYNMIGHTYRYFTPGEFPLYPFGYGLSYTSFLYTSVTLSSQSVPAGHSVTLTVGLLNTGNMDADEVVQVYVEWSNASSVSIPVPRLQLVAFKRQVVVKNQHVLIQLSVEPERLAVWGDSGWTYIKGLTTLYVGGQQPNQRTVAGSNVLKATFNIV